jgi:hypothetical protein
LYGTFRGTLEDTAASDKRIIFALPIEFTDMRSRASLVRFTTTSLVARLVSIVNADVKRHFFSLVAHGVGY